jgi:methyl-accepting chemotaxis protein
VAAEVRTLAKRSADAAREIRGLIDDTVGKVRSGTDVVNTAGVKMNRVVDGVTVISTLLGEISTAASQQSQGVRQVGSAITQLDAMTQQNAALVEQTAAAAEALKEQAEALVGVVSHFRVEPVHNPG